MGTQNTPPPVMPSIAGFTTELAAAWWLYCDRCLERTLVFGPTADIEAVVWATAHRYTAHRDADATNAGA